MSTTQEQSASDILSWISIGNLRESKLNTRSSYDDKKMSELADSIKRLGVLTPLLARPRPSGEYEIAAGHRRYRAAKLANLKQLPVRVREMTDAEFLEIASHYRVDAKKIRAAVVAEQKAKVKTKARLQTSAKSKKKGKK